MGVVRRAWEAIDDRTGLSKVMGPVLRHPVPSSARWYYVFGSATLFAFLVQVVTGIALALAYIPSTSDAYQTLQFITHQAPFGGVLRGIHYWGASAMVFLIGLHMARTFLMGAYKYPREANWLTGVVLFMVTIVIAFTGQLLRWDQTAVWTVAVVAEQVGRIPFVGEAIAHFVLAGDTWGGQTLSRFFAFHVFFIPAVIFVFIGVHLWLVLHHGISEPPTPGRPVEPKTYRAWYHAMLDREGRPFWPDAAWRDVVFGVAMVTAVVLAAVVFGAPELDRPPDPTVLQADPRPDWYLLWYFGALALIPPDLENYFMILGPMIAGVVLLVIPFVSNRGERSPARRPWAVGSVLVVCLMIATLWIAGAKAPWSPAFDAAPLTSRVVGASGGPVAVGARLFHDKGCEACHAIAGRGGQRGPDLTDVGDRLTSAQMTWRILNGGTNMPAFANNITPQELDDVIAFLRSRTRR
ncbi:MAG TPA: cytochrome b N-terminal domain-containing protein [bacterium]|nr:cytochrome b N-terminal domain-containing protein [bacterium]